MDSITYGKLVDGIHCELVDGLPMTQEPFSVSEIKEAKELAETIFIVHRYRPSLEKLIYEDRFQRKKAERIDEELFRYPLSKKS